MTARDARSRLFGRVALAILLLAALAPSFSRVLDHLRADARAWAVVCSAQQPAAPGQGGEPAVPMLDCPMCLVAGQPALPCPPGPDASTLLLALKDVLPPAVPQGAVLPAFRGHAQPRAPPLSA